MANYANLLATIAANIYTNGNNEVTASMVKTAVDAMVASLGAGYQFMGIATPATTPSNTDVKQFYIASEPGTYTDFLDSGSNPLEVNDGEVAVLKYDTAWSKEIAFSNNDVFLPDESRFAFSPMDFQRGSLNSSGQYVSGVNYRITPTNILVFSEPLLVKCNGSGFMTAIAYFNSSEVLTEFKPYDHTDKFIAPGQKFRLSIKRDVEDPSEMASNLEFLAGISVIVPAAPSRALSSFFNADGHIINFLGDSYVQNNNDTFQDGWCYKFAHKHNMVGRNYGANGTTIAPLSEDDHTCFLYRATLMADSDYLVVIGGKNDYNHQDIISFDDFKAAVRSLIEYIIGRWPSVQLCFFTPWMVSEETEVEVGNTAKPIPLFDYIDAIKEICAEYGVACYDTANSGIYTWDAGFRHLYFQGDNDISHLNPDGHDLFLPRAEKFLLSVLG